MGNNQGKEKSEEENDILENGNLVSYNDAVTLLSDYLGGLTNKTDDEKNGKTDILNLHIEDVVTSSMTRGLHYPSWREDEKEDRNLQEHILSLYWITPKHLLAKFNEQDNVTMDGLSKAIHCVALMTCEEDPFEKLSYVVDCCKHTMEAVGKQKGADDLLPALMYVVLKSNPPKLYSNMIYLSSFLEMNQRTLNSKHEIAKTAPRLFGTIMDFCFTNIQIAVTYIKGLKADEETNTVIFEQVEHNYLEAETIANYNEEVNKEFKKDLDKHFKELQRALKSLIKTRVLIRDEHGENMEKIAMRLDDHKRNVLISKSVGLFVSIGGGIISIVGFGLMFATFGVSAILIPVGASLSGAGGMTASISGFVEYGINRSTAKEIKAMREKYELVLNEVFLSLKKIEKTVNNIWAYFQQIGQASHTLLNLVDITMKLVRIAIVLQDVTETGVTAFQAASTAGRGLSIAGVVFSAILLPIDMVFFGISVKDLATGEKAKQAEEIRAWLNQELPDESTIEKTMLKLKTGICNFVKEVRCNAKEGNAEAITECEQHLKECFEEVKDLLDSKKD